MRFFKFLIPLLILCLLLCSCTPMGKTNTDSSKIIRDMVHDYSLSEDEAAAADALKQLETVSPEDAALWKSIMENWHFMNHEMSIPYYELPEDLPKDDSLCIVVLGFQLNPDGSMKEELLRRLDTALSCGTQYPNSFILVTGGGTAASNRQATEAGEMARWLISQGIPDSRIIVEDRSRTTAENAIFSCAILKEQYPQIHSLAITTSDYHIPWGSVLFETQCLLDDSGTHVISCAACVPPEEAGYSVLSYQANGILELAKIR